MLTWYDLEKHHVETREWYVGYRFGEQNVYCPWDVIHAGWQRSASHSKEGTELRICTPSKGGKPRKQRAIITPVLAFTVSLYECRHTLVLRYWYNLWVLLFAYFGDTRCRSGDKLKKQSLLSSENDIWTEHRFKTNHIVHFEHPYGTTDFQLSLLILLL